MKIGIDIGGSHIGIATVNDNGEIVKKIEQDIKWQENMIQYILDYVDKAVEELSKTADIEEIIIGGPGNPNGTMITNLVNLKIDYIDFRYIADKYSVPIKTMNDAKAAALAEKKYGELKNTKDSVFLCLGTGIGGAIFLNNQLLVANRNPGFELGHMIIDRNGDLCNCGKRGCFETFCSMKRLKDRLKNVLEKITDNTDISNAIILKTILLGNLDNKEIQTILNEYINNLVIGLSNIIDIFEPEVICLGGSFVHFKDILYNPLVEEMEKRKYVFNKQALPKIVLAQLKNDAGIIGATLIK